VFVPVIMGLGLVTGRPVRRGVTRAVLIGVTAGGIVGAALLLWGRGLMPGIRFTTVSRHALTPKPYGALALVVLRDCGMLLAIALVGAVMLARLGLRSATLAVMLLAGAFILPFGQIRIHEFVSLDKHLAFSTIFLAVLAGWAVQSVRWRLGRATAAVVLVWLVVLECLWRSNGFFTGWPNIGRVVAVLDRDPQPGTYMSLEADAFKYYTRDHSHVVWQTAYGLYSDGPAAVTNSVRTGQIETFVYRSNAAELSPAYVRVQAVLQRELKASGRYRLLATFRVQKYRPGSWFIWQKVR
jgi:hypothetical protein